MKTIADCERRLGEPPIRVLMLATDLERGGLPLRLVKLALRLQHRGVTPIVGCLAPPGPLSHILTEQGVTTFSCDASGSMDATCLIRLARHVRRFDPDVIHATLFHANLAARWVGRLDRPRPIITATVTIEIERPLHRVLEALTGALSDLHVANSTAVAEHLVAELGMEESRITVVPNGIDLDEIAFAPALSRADMGLSDRCPLIVWAGRMDPVKDLETFVDVIGRIRARSDVQAVLLGDGPMKGQVAKAIASRRLDDVIFLRGWTQELPRWLKSADVLLFPSLTEGCPNVVLEAMACGCPLSRPTFQLRVIRDGVDGFLCAPERCSEFADRVMQVINDRARAEKWRHPSGQFCKVRPFLRR